MKISDILTDNLPNLLKNNFQEVYEFLDKKYYCYEPNFRDELENSLNDIEGIYSLLNTSNDKHLSFLFSLAMVCNRYSLSFYFLFFYDELRKKGIDIGHTLKAMYLINSISTNNNISNKTLEIVNELARGYRKGEDRDLINQVLKKYIFDKLHFNEDNQKAYTDILDIFKNNLLYIEIDFLDLDFFKLFLQEAEDKKSFIQKWGTKIHILPILSNQFPKIVEAEKGQYADDLKAINNITFIDILKYAKKYYTEFITDSNSRYDDLDRGRAILKEKEDLFQYIHSYGRMHHDKLQKSFNLLLGTLKAYKECNIIDYACGQAMGIMNLADFIKANKLDCKVKEIILVEPSEVALSRAMLHSSLFMPKSNIKSICKYLNDLESNDLIFENSEVPVIHIFSNVLDIENITLNEKLYAAINSGMSGLNLFICISPNINATTNSRLDIFYQYFKDCYITKHIEKEVLPYTGISYTKYSHLFEVSV